MPVRCAGRRSTWSQFMDPFDGVSLLRKSGRDNHTDSCRHGPNPPFGKAETQVHYYPSPSQDPRSGSGAKFRAFFATENPPTSGSYEFAECVEAKFVRPSINRI